MTLLNLVLEPKRMVLPSPIEIDAAPAHGLERTFHPERSDVDVPDDEGDEEHRNYAVHHLGRSIRVRGGRASGGKEVYKPKVCEA